MALLPITPPPGVKTNGTEYSNKNSWVEADLVRFENGYLTNIGGWQKGVRDLFNIGLAINYFKYTFTRSQSMLKHVVHRMKLIDRSIK